MEKIKKDCKKRIYQSVGLLWAILCIICGMLLYTYGQSIVSLCKGAQDIEEYTTTIVNKENIDNFKEIKNAYTNVHVKTIIGSYAEYGTKKGEKVSKDNVYFLMPIQDGTYFITIIANKENIDKLEELEKIFFKNLEKDTKDYPKGYEIVGGFVRLSDEEKAFALEFFEGYDENVKDISQLSNLMSPYAIHIDEIGNTPISTLYLLLCIVLILVCTLLIGIYVLWKDILLKDLYASIENLSEEQKEQIADDYEHVQYVHEACFGQIFFYKKTRFAYEIIPYENIIWLYKEQCSKQRTIKFQIQAYDISGKQMILYKNTQEYIVEKISHNIFDHCPQAIEGYQFSLHVTAMDNPEKLHKKVKELVSLHKEETIIEKDKKIEKDEKKKKKPSKTVAKRKEKNDLKKESNIDTDIEK